jgi:branched-chain amino acid transport system permease protein
MSWETVVQTSIDAITLGSLYALYALGIGLIFGIMRLINFAHGELVMAGGYSLVLLSSLWLPVRTVVAVAVAIALALAMERVAFRPVRGANPATLLVTSFAVSIILQSAAEMAFGALPRSTNVSTTLTESFVAGPILIPKLSVLTVAVTIVLLVGLVAFFRRTSLGVQMRAAAEDFSMARLMGVRANRVIAVAFAMSGILAGIAALLVVAQTGSVQTTTGVNVVVIAFVATILGGIGSLVGAVLGGFVLGVLTVALQASLPLELLPFRDAFVFGLVLLMLVVRPRGLIVSRASMGRV